MKKTSPQPLPAQIIRIDSSLDYVIKKPGHYIFELVAPRIEVNISSTMQAKGQDDLEMEILVHHQAPQIKAQTTLRAVGFDQSKISLKAKILIDPDCQKTESFLTERVLLVSEKARALAIPDLEILTDDVRCSHAASITKIPEDQIFYLTSRGLNRRAAEEMIVKGFLNLKEWAKVLHQRANAAFDQPDQFQDRQPPRRAPIFVPPPSQSSQRCQHRVFWYKEFGKPSRAGWL